jgi:PAS domain S-box-containing protein
MKNLKTKIYLSLFLLLAIIVSLGIFGSAFINQTADASKLIIRDNYRTLHYASAMKDALAEMNGMLARKYYLKDEYDWGELRLYLAASKVFEANLDMERANITEPSEQELVRELQSKYSDFKNIAETLKRNSISPEEYKEMNSLYSQIRLTLEEIYNINSEAILTKNRKSELTANNNSLYMEITGGLSALFALVLIFYLPMYIMKPVYELTGKIKEISQGNYNQKISITSDDEIGTLAKAFNAMSDKLKEYEINNIHKLLSEKKRLETIIQNLNDAILITDNGKYIIYANKAVQDLSGLKEKELIGYYAPDVAAHNDLIRDIIKDIMIDEAKSEGIFPSMHVVINNKEKYFSKEIISVKLQDNGEEIVAGKVFLLKNVTSFEERNAAKTNLIATISHELKTPLSSINISLKLLENAKLGNVNEEQKKIIQSVKQQTSRLSKMVNELLDFSQTESGNIKLRIVPVHPADIADYATTALMVLISEKNIHLDVRIEDNLPDINADIEKTIWALTNLITNAVRYTPKDGTILIEIRQENNYVSFTVKDNGPGISEEDQEKIFKKFVQVGEKNAKGRGLGLAITKEFVAAQNGLIGVQSELGAGSSFYFKLPIK